MALSAWMIGWAFVGVPNPSEGMVLVHVGRAVSVGSRGCRNLWWRCIVNLYSWVGLELALTCYHMLNGFWVVFAEIDPASLRLLEWVAAYAVKELRSCAKDCSVHWICLSSAVDCEVWAFGILVESCLN